jgi:E3 ubiquitin-protein ligase RAD18
MSSNTDANISDPSDWLHTSLSTFVRLESALRCQVCKEFYNTPMITSCSHTFCSICIRRCLSADGKCPTCRAGDQPSKLRRNWTVQELVDTFQDARPAALELARKDQLAKEDDEQGSKRRKRKLADTDIAHEEPAKQTRARQTRSSTRKDGSTSAPSSQNVVVLDSEDGADEDYAPEQPKHLDDGLVECPMCSRRMKEEQVFPHLDHCDGEPESEKKSTKFQ